MYARQPTRTDSATPLLQIVVAALSVITTKAVLASGYHYPLRLLLLHLSTSYILDGLRGGFKRWFGNSDRVGASPPHQRKESYIFIFVHLLQDLCTAGAMACEYEALLHFESLPTFAMLLCWDLLPPCWNRVPMVTFITTLMGLGTVLMFEQRLSLTGLGSIVSSIALRKIAALLKHATNRPGEENKSDSSTPGHIKGMTSACTIFLIMVLIYRHETPTYSPVEPSSLLALLLCSICDAVYTLQIGGSSFTPWDTLALGSMPDSFFIPALFQGFVAVGNILLESSKQPSAWQYAGFWIALMGPLTADADSTDNTSISADTDDLVLPISSLSKVMKREEQEECESQGKVQIRYMLQTLLIVACMWFSSYFGGLEQVRQHNMPLIARSSSSNMSQGPDSMDLVVSRYDESAYSVASYIGPILNMTPLSGLTTRVIIYSTGQDEPEDLRDDLRHHLPFNVDVVVRQRPNVGREGAAFLHHITTGWQDLADHTLFMQAELHYSWSVRRRIQDYFVPEMGLDGYPVQLIQSNPYPEDPLSKSTISSQYPPMTGYPFGLDIQSYPVISIGYYRIG